MLGTGYLLAGGWSGANGEGPTIFCAEKKWGVNRYYSKQGEGQGKIVHCKCHLHQFSFSLPQEEESGSA